MRAVTGAPQWDAPDVDDRGWLPDPAASYTIADVHGPVVGLPEGVDVRVKVDRRRLEATAPLQVVSKDASIFTVTTPAAGAALPADDIFVLHGVSAGSADAFAVGEIRLGTATGPLLLEFGVRVLKNIRLRVRPHLCTINGTACATGQADVDSLERVVNRIWRPCGVSFNFESCTGHNVSRTGYVRAGEITYNDSSSPVTIPAGTVAANYWNEFADVRAQGRNANAINLYFVGQFTNVGVPAANQHDLNAMTWDKTLSPTRHGVVMKDGADGNDLAHEFGHFLSLPHSDEPTPGNHSREDMYVLRQLMYSFRPFVPAVGYRAELGYGHRQRGALITLRNKAQFNRDAEWFDARRRARNPF